MDMKSKDTLIVSAHGLGKQVVGPEGVIKILDNVELAVNATESVAILGASGSGKSTLLGLLAGLDSPSTGHVELLGQNLNGLDEDSRARLRSTQVGFVFQTFQLLPGLTALENVMLPLELVGREDAEERAKMFLTSVGLDKRLRHYPSQLSGGEQQRVAIARAFVSQPQLVFADEPTGNLDHATGSRIIELIFNLQREHAITLVLVTHDQSLAARCQRRLYIQAGQVNTELAETQTPQQPLQSQPV